MKTLEKMHDISLTQPEKEALAQWEDQDLKPISITTAHKYYELYLQGCSCMEIANLNPGIHLGAIVNAKVRYGWDQQKAAYIEDLTLKTKQQASKTYLESVKFLSNLLSTVHTRFDTNFSKFHQTKDPEDLGPFQQIDGGLLKEYRSNLDLLFRLMGQDAKSIKGGPQVNVNVTSNGDTNVDFEDAEAYLKKANDKQKLDK